MIEQLLQALVDALNRNTAALTGAVGMLNGGTEVPAAEAPPRGRGRPPKNPPVDVAAVAVAPTATATSPVAPPVAAAAPASAPVASVSSPALTFKDAADALIALADGVSRDAAVALLKRFGASKAPELKPQDYPQFIAEANAQVAAKNVAPPSAGAGLI